MIGRTTAIPSMIAGSSAWAAAAPVSIDVKHRIPSAIVAWRMSAASRTTPERGVGVLTTSRTLPDSDQLQDADLVAHLGPRPAWRPATRSPNPARSSDVRVPPVAASR